MFLVQAAQGVLIVFDFDLENFDMFCSSLSKGSLCLPVSLFTFFGRCIDLDMVSTRAYELQLRNYTGFRPPFLFLITSGSG